MTNAQLSPKLVVVPKPNRLFPQLVTLSRRLWPGKGDCHPHSRGSGWAGCAERTSHSNIILICEGTIPPRPIRKGYNNNNNLRVDRRPGLPPARHALVRVVP
jgi:hypothetical protein